MITVSDKYKENIKNGNRNFGVYSTLTLTDGTEIPITNSCLWSGGFTIEDAVSEDSVFQIGGAIINQCTVILNNIYEEYSDYDFYGAKLDAIVGLTLDDGTVEKMRKGTFAVADTQYNGSLITLTCYDNMYLLDVAYDSKLLYPAKLESIASEICSYCGVKLSTITFPHSEVMVNVKPMSDGLTCRTALMWICQLCGCFARFNNYGELEIKWFDRATLDNPEDNQGKYHSINNSFSKDLSTNDIKITGFKVVENSDSNSDPKEYFAGTDDYVVSIEENDLIVSGIGAEVVERLSDEFIGLKFRSGQITHLGDPTIEAGDIVIFTDEKNRQYKMIVSGTTYTLNGSQTTRSSAEAPIRNNSQKYSNGTRNYAKAKDLVEKEKNERKSAIKALNKRVENVVGFYSTEETDSAGGKIFYIHDKPTLKESSMAWKMTAEAIAASTSKDSDGNFVWTAGIMVNGDVIARILNAIGVNASWINTGSLTVKDDDGNIIFSVDVDTKNVTVSGAAVKIKGNSVEKAIEDIEGNVEKVNNTVVDVKESSVIGSDIFYALSDSNTVAPTDGWQTNPPTWEVGKYMWQKTRLSYGNGTTSESDPVCIYGSSENGIKTITKYFAVSDSMSVPPEDSEFTTTKPIPTEDKKYLWVYENAVYTDGLIVNTAKKTIGYQGVSINEITSYYLVTDKTSGITNHTSGFLLKIQYPTAKKRYLWNYDIVSYSNSTVNITAPRIIGIYGNTGRGTKSVTEQYYLSDSSYSLSGGEWDFIYPDWVSGKYIWTRTHIVLDDDSTIDTEPTLAKGINTANENAADAIEKAENSDPFITGTQTHNTSQWKGNAPFSSLKDGQKITYWLPFSGIGEASLNLSLANGGMTGLVSIYYGGTTPLSTQYPAGSIIRMVYRDGVDIAGRKYTGWWCDANYDTGDTFDKTKYAAEIKASSAISAGTLIVGNSSGYHPLNDGTDFDISYPVLFANSAIEKYATGTDNYTVIAFNVNATQKVTLSPYMAVYLQGVLDGSRFKPVSKQPLVQTVPTTMDGYYYMLVGIAYASDTIMLQAEHPIYRNLGGKFQKMGATADETILQWCKNNDLTYIDGGKIYAKSVTSQEIDTEELFAQKISATNMSITGESQVAGFHISGNQLYTLNGTRGELYFGESDDNLNLIEIKEFISGSGYDTYFSVDNVGQVSCNELTVQNGGNANIGGKITADSIVSAKVMTANDRQKDNYEWKNVDTVNNSLTAALVVDPYTAEVHMRNLPKGEFDLENSNGWYRYGKRTFIKLNGEFVGAVESCPYPPQGNTVYQWVMLLNVSEGTWWPGFMEITMDGSVSFRTVTALGVTELFECTGTGFRVYGYIDFFNG